MARRIAPGIAFFLVLAGRIFGKTDPEWQDQNRDKPKKKCFAFTQGFSSNLISRCNNITIKAKK